MTEQVTDYRTIVADPPWTPKLNAGHPSPLAGPQNFYPTLSVKEICALKPPSPKQAHLYLWVISQHIDWGYEVARAWGFEPQHMLTWCKPGLGVGRFQSNTEHVLICRKGSRQGNPFGHLAGTYYQWPRGRHSEKPDEFFKLVESASPGPYLEMFARTRRTGWDAFEIKSRIQSSSERSTMPQIFNVLLTILLVAFFGAYGVLLSSVICQEMTVLNFSAPVPLVIVVFILCILYAKVKS